MKKIAIVFAVLVCLHLFHHHRRACACDTVVAAPVVASYGFAAPYAAFAAPVYAQPVFATPFYGSNVAVVNARGVSVAVGAGANVRVRRGVFGGTVVRVR